VGAARLRSALTAAVWRALAWVWTHPLLGDRARTYLMWSLNAKYVAGVTAVIHNPHGEVLLLQHAFRRTYPWALPGGWIGRHESPEEAVVREVAEETGLRIEVAALLTARTFTTPRLDVVYLCRLVSDPSTVRGSAETPRWRWCAAGDYPPGADPYSVALIDLATSHAVPPV
jgi:8-oxo-dGTP pyrophosphatase MutT (NUDIX family)